MSPDLDKLLIRKFPNLYADRNGDMKSTAMCWGFECDDGWFQIIHDLSEKLEPLIVKYKKEAPDADWHPRASQVKEKFGTLRFYMSSQTDEMDAAITAAEDASCITCESCGQPGKSRGGGWIQTLCDTHAEERAKGRAP